MPQSKTVRSQYLPTSHVVVWWCCGTPRIGLFRKVSKNIKKLVYPKLAKPSRMRNKSIIFVGFWVGSLLASLHPTPVPPNGPKADPHSVPCRRLGLRKLLLFCFKILTPQYFSLTGCKFFRHLLPLPEELAPHGNLSSGPFGSWPSSYCPRFALFSTWFCTPVRLTAPRFFTRGLEVFYASIFLCTIRVQYNTWNKD